MRRRVTDASTIELTLGWRATFSIEQILSNVIEHELAMNMLQPQGASSQTP